MATPARWNSQSHAAALPLDALPSEYKFATSPPAVDAMRSWNKESPATLNRQLSNEERMARTIRRKFSGDADFPRPEATRRPTPPENRSHNSHEAASHVHRPTPQQTRPVTTFTDRQLSNEERYLKNTVDERVARALHNDRKATASEDRSSKVERKAPPRLELSRLFNRRKSSKNSNQASTPSSAVSDHLELSPFHGAFRLRKSRSRDSPVEQPPPQQYEQDHYKINVRKPPPGIQHWFEGLSEDYAASVFTHSRQNSAELPKPHGNRTRDTFLSNSTDKSEADVVARKLRNVPARKPLHGVGIPRSPRLAAPADPRDVLRRTTSDVRPSSQHSSGTSVLTAQPIGSPNTIQSRLRRLPDSIEDSVLVLSETDESDDEQALEAENALDESLRRAAAAGIFTPAEPAAIRSPTMSSPLDKPLPPVRVSTATVIEDESQVHVVDDGYSARTSLLSDLRTLSFHSHVSQSTLEEEEWDQEPPSPTTSMNYPERAMRQYFSTDPFEDRPDSDHRWNHGGPTHKLMAVTPEEAALLSAMRKKRAQMHAIDSGRRGMRPVTAPVHVRSKSQAAATRQRRAEQQPVSLQTVLGPATTGESPASEDVSPFQVVPERALGRSNSIDTVSMLWDDVQKWRRLHGAVREQAPPAPQRPRRPVDCSRFSADSDLADSYVKTRPQLPPLPHSEDQNIGRAQRVARDSQSIRRSKSLGRASGLSSGRTDPEADVLAAWNELGGWRRSAAIASHSTRN